MEYYIMKLYEKRKKDANLKLGFNRFSKMNKIVVTILFIVMFLSFISMLLLLFLFPNKPLFFVAYTPCILAVLILFVIDSRDQKINLDNRIEEYKKQLEILKEVLSEFKISTDKDLKMLKKKYMDYIRKKEEEGKARNKIILTLFSALSGILSISFLNLTTIGIDFYIWLYIAIFLFICIDFASVLIYCGKYFNSLKNKYESILCYLNDIKFEG